jgi:putative phosphoribosyl transferase
VTAQPPFRDREDAGRHLAQGLAKYAGAPGLLVIGLPRGGIPVARVVADDLHAPLEVFVARKLGVPGIPEVALGAISEGSDAIVEESVSWFIGVPRRVLQRIAARERQEIARRVAAYRPTHGLPAIRDRTVILVDDGAASGATLSAAAQSLGNRRPARLVVATPVASQAALDSLRPHCADVVTLATPDPFQTVSTWYRDFAPVSDEHVSDLLGRTHVVNTAIPEDAERPVHIPLDGEVLEGDLGTPNEPSRGLIILAHGGGSSRASYRNRYLAGRLRLEGLATLRLDLLTKDERATDANEASLRFEVPRIAHRMLTACEWLCREGVEGASRLAIIGASTAAAAALVAAAVRPELVHTVISRGGRVDLANDALRRVRVPVLLIVGSADPDTLRWNRAAARLLQSPARLIIVPGASHTFEKPGALGAVGEHVTRWLARREGRGTHSLAKALSGIAQRVRFTNPPNALSDA